MDGVGDSSTVRRILLGSLLRRLRESKNISMREAGYHIRATESKISRLETGKVSFKERDVEDLLTFYGVLDGKERDQVLDLVREANAQGWWHSFSEVLPSWFEAFIGLESAASVVRTYEVQFVPGLLQCPQYVDAVLSSNRAQSTTDLRRRIELRQRRQAALERDDAPILWVVLDEAALRRPIGGPEVMKAQIAYLIEQAERPNITIQLLPYSVGAHAAEGGAFTLLRFAEADLPDVVYLEHLTGAQYIERPEDVEQYARAMDRISVDALHPEATLEALKALLNP
ncbi:helix-turn-helix transcriptional regulator [Actinocrinis sp.]|uniref:helix-turn-helix domain-containing protein n=1 Tax=Actinocrinis sp. TaxID=1920516 RepID=UPI002D645B1E|nr:helix-turn-helix transcriptional regulator [Actinocrinis sp.]HZP50904.1 helix-turn-helix transcriptional regulator [Actinocrinis sp.]